MFDQLVEIVKDQIGGNPAIPADRSDDVHREVASQIQNGLKSQAASTGGAGGVLSMLTGSLGSGNPLTSAISGGVVGSLGSKFGLPPAATGAIAAALPGILQKFTNKANDPNDPSLTPDSITKAISGSGGGSLGGALGNLF